MSATASSGSRARWGVDGLSLGISLSGWGDARVWSREMAWMERADALRLHSVWLPEMHFTPRACSTPLLALAAFAARSKRLRLGTSSLLLPIHPPGLLADAVTTLQHVSQDRVLLGLGRGFRRPLFDAFGIDPSTKRDRFDQVLDAMLERWGESAPPLAVAAFGPKGLAQSAARGLPYLVSPLESLGLIRENHLRHRNGLPPGCDPAGLVVPALRTVHIASDDGEATRVLDAITQEQRAGAFKAPPSLARAMAEPLEERVIIGTRSAVEDRLAEYREAIGLNLLIVHSQLAGAEASERVRSLETLSEVAASFPA